MDENTVFQGGGASAQPQPSSPPQNTIPVQSAGPAPLPNVTPQPVTPTPFVPQPILQSSPTTPTVSVATPVTTGAPQVVGPTPPPPPIMPPAASSPLGSHRSFPLGGILKAVVGVVILLILMVVLFTVVVPLFSSNKNEKVTLTYWGLWEDPNVMQKIIDDFQKENPTITIKYEKQDIKDDYRKRLQTRIANGNGPDIYQFHNSWVPEIKGILAPLPVDVITPDAFKKAYFPVVSEDLIKNGAIYGVPLQIDTLALYTNTDMLEASSLEPPTNWEDFGRDARMLTVKDENGKIKTAGAALGTYDNITHAPDILSLLFLQNGANIYDLSSTSGQSIDTLNYYTQDYAMGDSNVWDTSLDPSLLAFSKGNLAMYFGYSWDIFAIQAMNPSLHFKITPVPHLPLGKKITVASYWVEGVSPKSKYQKQSMLFMKYLTRKETLEKLYTEATKTRAFGQLYPRPDLAESLKGNNLIYPFVSQASDAVSTFFVSDTYDKGLNEQADTYLGNAVRSLLDGTSAETALETLSSGVSQVLKQYGL